jgi:hypothetical protein
VPNKLLEAHDERLDSGPSSEAVTEDLAMATVGAFNRSTDH